MRRVKMSQRLWCERNGTPTVVAISSRQLYTEYCNKYSLCSGFYLV